MPERNDVAPDGLLASLVGVANGTTEPMTTGINVILTLAGQTVSGFIIPNWQWHQEVEAIDRQTAQEAGVEAETPILADLFKSAKEGALQQRDEERAVMEASEQWAHRYQKALCEADPVAFIHLRDARVFVPGQHAIPTSGMFWRGRLGLIVGWSYGVWSVTETTD